MRSRPRSRSAKSSMWCSTITPHTKTSQAEGLAGAAPAVRLPLHPEIVLLAQCGRDPVLEVDAAAAEAGRIPLNRRTPSRHQPLPHGNQCRSQALRLDRSPRPRHCCRAARDPSVRVGALGASAQADGERDIERLSDTDRAPAGKLPNYGRHRPMATPLGSPHLICSTIC